MAGPPFRRAHPAPFSRTHCTHLATCPRTPCGHHGCTGESIITLVRLRRGCLIPACYCHRSCVVPPGRNSRTPQRSLLPPPTDLPSPDHMAG